jgi:hypothetical protein
MPLSTETFCSAVDEGELDATQANIEVLFRVGRHLDAAGHRGSENCVVP